MQLDYGMFLGLIALVAVVTIGSTFLIYKRGIAIKMISIVVGMTVAAAIAGFMFGKEGLNLVACIVAVGVIGPAYSLMLLLLRKIILPIKQISDCAYHISQGEINRESNVSSWDEIQDLILAFGQMRDYLNAITGVAEKIAGGDLSVAITPVSEQDLLGTAFVEMIAHLRQTVNQVAHSADSIGEDYSQVSAASEQASRSVENIDSRLQQITEGTARQTKELAVTTNAVEQMIRALNEVSKGAQEQAKAVAKAFNITTDMTQKITRMAENARSGAEGASQAAQAAHEGANIIEFERGEDGQYPPIDPEITRKSGVNGPTVGRNWFDPGNNRGDRLADQPAGAQCRNRSSPGR